MAQVSAKEKMANIKRSRHIVKAVIQFRHSLMDLLGSFEESTQKAIADLPDIGEFLRDEKESCQKEVGRLEAFAGQINHQLHAIEQEQMNFGRFLREVLGPKWKITTDEIDTDAIDEILSTLSDREEKVLRLRFALPGGSRKTLKEIGQKLNYSGETIRQCESRGLRKLRHPTRLRTLVKILSAVRNEEE